MHLQRALEMEHGPRAIIATNRGLPRLASLHKDFASLARAKGCDFIAFSPEAEPARLERELERLTGGRGCDDIVVVAPNVTVIEQAAPYLARDGMLVLFAGVRSGQTASLPLDLVALHGAQITGTSGSKLADQLALVAKIQAGKATPARAVAAIGGLKALGEGLAAVIEQRYPGKVVIFPQLLDLPLTSLTELETILPELSGQSWTPQVEQALFEHYLK